MKICELELDKDMDMHGALRRPGRQDTRWSDYVKCSKYFGELRGRSYSAPCIPSSRHATPFPASPNLSLAWLLACSPVMESATPVAHNSAPTQQGTSEQVPSKADRPVLRCGKPRHVEKRKQPVQQHVCVNSTDTPKILVVDATVLRDYWSQKSGDWRNDDSRGGDRRTSDVLDKEATPPKKTILKIKNPYAVPLCYRPTTILGSKSYEDRQLREEQQHQQHEHHRESRTQGRRRNYNPLQHVTRLAQRQIQHCPKYVVPMESLYRNPKRGSRYCGNFYYN